MQLLLAGLSSFTINAGLSFYIINAAGELAVDAGAPCHSRRRAEAAPGRCPAHTEQRQRLASPVFGRVAKMNVSCERQLQDRTKLATRKMPPKTTRLFLRAAPCRHSGFADECSISEKQCLTLNITSICGAFDTCSVTSTPLPATRAAQGWRARWCQLSASQRVIHSFI